jgi:hypothetical protein
MVFKLAKKNLYRAICDKIFYLGSMYTAPSSTFERKKRIVTVAIFLQLTGEEKKASVTLDGGPACISLYKSREAKRALGG